MCLGIPMRIVEMNGLEARCDAKGIERTVSLFLLQHEPLAAGDHVMVHVGYAIQKMSPAQAEESWLLYDQILSIQGGARDA